MFHRAAHVAELRLIALDHDPVVGTMEDHNFTGG